MTEPTVSEPTVSPTRTSAASRPAELQDAIRLADQVLALLAAALDALEDGEEQDDLADNLHDARDAIMGAIGYMTADPQSGYVGRYADGEHAAGHS